MDEKVCVLSYLVGSTEKQLDTLELYETAEEMYKKSDAQSISVFWKDAIPSKQAIKDNLKMIRRIALEIEKEI